MNRFMIGLHGGFDARKMERDYRDAFLGVECCSFGSEEDTKRLLAEQQARGLRIGVHFPFRSGQSRIRDALFLSQDSAVREDAYVKRELDYLTRVRPDYVLFHYPKPVLLDERVDWRLWRFTDAAEYVNGNKYDRETLRFNSEALFQWLSERSAEYGFTPVLELDAIHPYIYETDLLEQLLGRYGRIRLCLDTGRLHLQERMDARFSARDILRKYSRRAEVIHLSTMKVTDRVEHNHFPALPELDSEKGWAPIADYLTIVREENAEVKLLFEHRSELIGDDALERCYRWVEKLMNG